MTDYPYRKLYRCKKDRMIAGVCSGLALHFGIDPTIIRLIAVLLLLFGGLAIFVYLILWAVVPLQPDSGNIN